MFLSHLQCNEKQVEMVAAAFLQFVLFPVDDDSGDLLVHEDEDGGEERGQDGSERAPPFILERVDHPSPVVTSWLCKESKSVVWRTKTVTKAWGRSVFMMLNSHL